MTKIDILNREGSSVGEIELNDAIFMNQINVPIMHQAVRVYLASQRRGTHSTKNRAAVSGGGKKPWRQKGTGRASFGSSRNPVWHGGGVAFGPTPRDYSITMPKKMRRAALLSALSSKLADGKLIVIDELDFDAPKTKEMARILEIVKPYVDMVDISTGGVVPEGGSSDSSSSSGNTESNAGVQLAIGAASGELNFRDKPSTSTGKVLATLKKGEQFQILGETDEWYYVIYNGKTGFVYKAYARVESSGSVGIARVSDSVAPISTTTTAEVNLRHGMSTSSEIIRLLPNKTSVTVYMIFDGWCFLSQNGTFGFCVTDYVKL